MGRGWSGIFLDWHELSLQFYLSEKIGAGNKEEWVGLGVEGRC
jgi:hypothetical protein